MNIKKFGAVLGSILLVLYVLFLIVPFFLTGLVNSYNDEISKAVEEASGFKLKIDKVRVLTTPKLTAGIGVGELVVAQPDGEEFIAITNAEAKLSLIPLIFKRVEADVVKMENFYAALKVQPDGSLSIEKYLPEANDEEEAVTLTGLPFGFKLSNRLPDVRVKNYDVSLIDIKTGSEYSIEGSDFKITDFVLNKKLKFSTNGLVKLGDTSPFNYDINIYNKIMPDLNLNDLVFGQNPFGAETSNSPEVTPIALNVIDILEGIRKNQLGADFVVDVKTSKDLDNIVIDGLVDVENIALAVNGKLLPKGHVKLDFNHKKLITDAALYTADDEKTTVIGEINGKSKKINIAVKSNAHINNIFNIIKSVASSFNYNDLQTLSATGAIDADFNIKSDMKKLTSDGYFNIPSATIKYALYNVLIDKINADVDFAGDELKVKNIGFSILNQPLKIYGTVKSDTTTDLHLIADKLLLKGLLVASGQVGLLKENDVKSGTISADASVKGKLKEIKPHLNVIIDNVNVLNKPSSTSVKLAGTNVDLSSDGKNYKGIVDVNSVKIINPMAAVSLPKAKISLDSKDVNIDDTYLLLDNSRFDITGKISDYTSKNIALNLKAQGNLVAKDVLSMVPAEMRSMLSAKGTMPLLVTINGNDKKQVADIQLLATPSGYFKVVDVAALSGKNTLIRSNISVADNSLKFTDSGVYVTGASKLPASLDNLSPVILLKGGIQNLTNPQFNNLNISTKSAQTISIPGFKNSKAVANANITLNGSLVTPVMSGNLDIPEVSLPAMKTDLKNVAVNLNGKLINISLPSISVANSLMSAKASVSSNFANGVLVKSVDFKGNLIDADTLAAAFASNSAPASSTSAGTGTADLGVVVQNGKGSVAKFKSGNIVATDLTADFGLKNNVFYLKNLKGNAFSGKINGDINVNVLSGKTSVKMSGSGMKAVDAIEGAAAIHNALSGTLGFNADLKLNAFASPYNALMKSITGDITFSVKDGHYANIGRLDNLLLAKNLAANVILKAALVPIRSMPVVQNSSEFKNIDGSLSLNNGVANLKSVKSSGPSMAYYVKGKYNLISGYTNVVILGRLGSDLVVALGPLGQLSASKLTSYIPKFGAQTAAVLNSLTSNPSAESISQIPALTGGNNNTKDFKVVFDGNVTSASSIKSFKWLTTCDTSGITGGTLKEQFKSSTEALKTSGKTSVQDVKKSVEDVKESAKTTAEDIKNQVQKTKDSIKELKNLKNMFKSPVQTQTPAPEPAP